MRVKYPLAVVVIGGGVYLYSQHDHPDDNPVSDTVQRIEMGADSVGAKLDEIGAALDRGQIEVSGAEDSVGELQGSLDERTDLIDDSKERFDRIEEILNDIADRNGINGTRADDQRTAE
ncbi:Uncharacterised protein [uncultured Ruminococcus sp.]|nr:Uncharacterised protein [uncultured Ruminococcus sp.]